MKESNITFPLMETGTTNLNEEREKVAPVNSSSNVELGYLKNSQTKDLIDSISTLTNTRLREFRDEMITMINKMEIKCVLSSGDRDSYYEYFETNNLPKGEKCKTGNTHSDYWFALLKNSTENNNNDPVVGQKKPITNNDGGNNTPEKVLYCQNPAKTVSDVEVDLEILNQVDQEHQIPQNLGDAIWERLTSKLKSTGYMNQKNLAKLKNYMKNLHEILHYWSHKIVEKYAPLC